MICFLIVEQGKGKILTLKEELGKCYIYKVLKVTLTRYHVDTPTVMLHFTCGILSKTPKDPSKHEKAMRQTQIQRQYTIQLVSISQDCPGHEKQGETTKLLQARGDLGDMTTKWSVVLLYADCYPQKGRLPRLALDWHLGTQI